MKNTVKVLTLFFFIFCADCSPSEKKPAPETFYIGAIPDQNPEKLQRAYSKLVSYFEVVLKVPVEYKPVIDYTGAVTAFRVGDLDMVWFGGLTGVQARLQVPSAEAIVQRDIDPDFHSVFIAHVSTEILPFQDLADLQKIKGKRFTFGSQSSTSGRLMPQHYLGKAGIENSDFRGDVGFSGSHDITIKLVESGTYEVGVLSEQVWLDRVNVGEVDLKKVQVIWRTPSFFDYHWVINTKNIEKRHGKNFAKRVKKALLALDIKDPKHAEILDLFGAKKFIPTTNENYTKIERVGRKLGKIK